MPKQLEALMWEQACEAMERAQRLHRQFFHRSRTTPAWEAPCDIFESDEALTILIALPGVEPDQIKVTLSAGVLIVSGERPLPREVSDARIELPPARFEIAGRHLANGCLKLQLHKV
jgi:HSP20 family molecular chaperone IbpA